MKQKILLLVVLAALIGGAVALSASNVTATAVPIPAELNVALEGLIFALVTAGFSYLFQWLGLDLRGLATPLSGVLSGWVLLELQGLVNLIPPAYDLYVSIGFKILVVVLSGVGSLFLYAKLRGNSLKLI